MEIQKEIRLPQGYVSWLQVATAIQLESTDAINLKETGGHERFKTRMHGGGFSPLVETFEIDVLTLKSRVFDELIDLIPTYDEAINIIRALKMMQRMALPTGSEDPTYEKGVEHFQKIITLLHDRF
jgi:hypothetical protein